MTDTASTSSAPTPPRPPIVNLADLQNHLWEACYVEMSTIPLYLYAMYSIQSQIEGGTAGYVGNVNQSSSASAISSMSAFRTIRSIVIEEMLHLTLARNVLYSTGGSITFYDPCFVPRYGVVEESNCTPPGSPPPGAPLDPQTPGQQYMLHRIPLLPFNLAPCTKDQVANTFIPLESPAPGGATTPESDWYQSISDFYTAIVKGFESVQNAIGAEELFGNNQAAYQLHSVASYWNQEGGGSPMPVTDLDSVKAAVAEILAQGEGAGGTNLAEITVGDPSYVRNYEYSHLEKFERIHEAIDEIGAMWPLKTNPRLADYSGSLRQLAEFCNAVYCYALMLIDANYTVALPDDVVNGTNPLPPSVYDDPAMKEKWGLTQALLTTMSGILFPVIDVLVRQPLTDDGSVHAGPTFEFYAGFQDIATAQERKQHLLDLCDALVPTYPALGGADSARRRISELPAV